MSVKTPLQTGANCDTSAKSLLSVAQAQQRILEFVEVIKGTERLALRSALNRILAQEIFSPINVPPYNNSAMDGYAFRHADLQAPGSDTFTVIGTSFAGDPFTGKVNSGECVRIMTGAKMPDGADTVSMQENTQRDEDVLIINCAHQANDNVRFAGEDIATNDVVFAPGQRIGPAELGVIASLGFPEITVHRRLRVAIFSTGDELKGVGEPLAEGQIYDSNRYTLYGMLRQLDVELVDMGVIADDPQAVENAFTEAAQIADVVLTSGGVSVGDADFVKQTLDKLGQVDFWKIAMKPGKPLAFGKLNDAIFLGLPGNPVSVMATFYIFALPALKRMMGETISLPFSYTAKTRAAIKKHPGRTDFQRGILGIDDNGELVVDVAGIQASHILTGMSKANCFVVLPAQSGSIEAGSEVLVQPFHGLMG